jgi:hypothetical protein
LLKWLETNHSQHHQNLEEILRLANYVRENPREATLASFLIDETCQRVFDLSIMYMDELQYISGQLASFWLMYVDLVGILGLNARNREGDGYST